MVAKGKRVIIKEISIIGMTAPLIWDGRIFATSAAGGWNSRPVKCFDTAACKMDGNALVLGLRYTLSDSKLGKDLLPDLVGLTKQARLTVQIFFVYLLVVSTMSMLTVGTTI